MADFSTEDHLKATDVALRFAEAELEESSGAATPRAAAFLMSAQSSIEAAQESPYDFGAVHGAITAAAETPDDPRSHVIAARTSLNEALSSLGLTPADRGTAERSAARRRAPHRSASSSMHDVLFRSYRLA